MGQLILQRRQHAATNYYACLKIPADKRNPALFTCLALREMCECKPVDNIATVCAAHRVRARSVLGDDFTGTADVCLPALHVHICDWHGTALRDVHMYFGCSGARGVAVARHSGALVRGILLRWRAAVYCAGKRHTGALSCDVVRSVARVARFTVLALQSCVLKASQ